jgi:hypothetical protein
VDIADFSLDLFSLAGRNALVTGGNTGLGRAFSAALAKAGADVFAVGLAEDDGTTQALIEAAGRRFVFEKADITQPGVPAAITRSCVEALGSVDMGSAHLPTPRPRPGSRASPRPTATSWRPSTSRSTPSRRATSRPPSPKRPGPIPRPPAASSSTSPRTAGGRPPT